EPEQRPRMDERRPEPDVAWGARGGPTLLRARAPTRSALRLRLHEPVHAGGARGAPRGGAPRGERGGPPAAGLLPVVPLARQRARQVRSDRGGGGCLPPCRGSRSSRPGGATSPGPSRQRRGPGRGPDACRPGRAPHAPRSGAGGGALSPGARAQPDSLRGDVSARRRPRRRWPDGRGASPLGEDAPDGRGSARRGDGPRGTPAARESPVGSGGGGERHGPRPAAAGRVLYFSPLIGG